MVEAKAKESRCGMGREEAQSTNSAEHPRTRSENATEMRPHEDPWSPELWYPHADSDSISIAPSVEDRGGPIGRRIQWVESLKLPHTTKENKVWRQHLTARFMQRRQEKREE